ncbi:MAG TPA: aspartate aminotransferase family protein [Thermoleophilaceae bacterium]|nr:aspartate aminotransferase family protein [Thermoleophilaceae bacterium]
MKQQETRFWHPFANMAEVAGHEFTVTRAKGVHLWDDAGRRHLDASASLWCANVGHGRPEIAAAVHAQLLELDAYMTFGDYTNPQAEELCRRLAELAPVPGARVFLGSGGGDAIEMAAKLARQYWALEGMPRRQHVLGRVGGYHGTHGFGTSIGGIEANRAAFGPLVAATGQVDRDDLGALERRILELGPDSVAAFVCEPVLGAGGVRLPEPGYIEGAAALCAEYGVLFVVDSVICAFGRLGTWFGIERWDGVEPDMITFAKGVSNGALPLGGTIVSERVAEPFWEGEGSMFRHGQTYSGHSACCVAALANIEVLEQENLIPRGQELEGDLHDALRPLADHPLIAEVRAGLGLLAAVELDAGALAREPGLALRLQRAVRERCVLVRPLPTALAISPPLTIEREQLQEIADAIDDAVREVAHDIPARSVTG